MNKKFPIIIALCCCFILADLQGFAQSDKKEESRKKEERQKRDKEDKADKDKKDQESDDRKDESKKKDKDYNDDRKYKEKNSQASRKGGIFGRVILPKRGTNSPRQLAGVPKGHYPPPGSCRIWYPNRPAGHQPPPVSCSSLTGVRLEPGAFILHGDRAYDADYDWKEVERRRPGTVSRDILDILFPNRQ